MLFPQRLHVVLRTGVTSLEALVAWWSGIRLQSGGPGVYPCFLCGAVVVCVVVVGGGGGWLVICLTPHHTTVSQERL